MTSAQIGGAVKAKTAHIDTLGIGDLTIRNQNFFVIDIPADKGIPQLLVGWEFLKSFAVRIDFRRSELNFFDLSHFAYGGSGTAVPLILETHGNGIHLDAKVDGIAGRFQLDSGNEIGFSLTRPSSTSTICKTSCTPCFGAITGKVWAAIHRRLGLHASTLSTSAASFCAIQLSGGEPATIASSRSLQAM